jgi:hypothetical protein
MTQVKSRTKLGVFAVRILANGAEDLPKAVEAQKGFVSMPLSAYLREGLAYKRPAERPMTQPYESEAPEPIRYFDDLGYCMGKMLPVCRLERSVSVLLTTWVSAGRRRPWV